VRICLHSLYLPLKRSISSERGIVTTPSPHRS
jgi:hypothetical protein